MTSQEVKIGIVSHSLCTDIADNKRLHKLLFLIRKELFTFSQDGFDVDKYLFPPTD